MLRDRARQLGLCDQWYDQWDKEETKQELIEKYLKGIDFCIKHDYPKPDFIRAYFPNSILVKNCIFLDTLNVETSNLSRAVFLGKSNGRITYDGVKAGNIYLRHESELDVKATGGARVFIETYEGCRLNVEAKENSKVFVYRHGGEVHVSGNVMVRDKRKAGD